MCSAARRAASPRLPEGLCRDDDLTPSRAATPSRRRSVAATSCSKRRPAPARRACSSSATSTCCAPASIPITSSRSRSRARPPPRCASASSTGCARRAGCRSSTPARWRDLKDRLGDIAISTIDAFCLSLLREFPLEADVDPGFDLADDTEVPRLVGESLDQALRICRGIARRRRRRGAGVRAARRAAAARPGWRALLDRRLVAPQALRRYLCERPARPDGGGGVPARRRRRLRERLRAASRAASTRSCTTARVQHPQFAMLAGDIARCCASMARNRRHFEPPRRAGRVPRARRSAARYFLTQDGEPRGEAFAGHRLQRGALRLATTRGSAIAQPPRQIAPRDRRSAPRLPPRSERRAVARRLADLRGRAAASTSARSRRTRCSISPACSSARSSC